MKHDRTQYIERLKIKKIEHIKYKIKLQKIKTKKSVYIYIYIYYTMLKSNKQKRDTQKRNNNDTRIHISKTYKHCIAKQSNKHKANNNNLNN